MGAISNKLIEFAEMYEDFLWHTGSHAGAIRNIQQQLKQDEFEFFMENIETIKEMFDSNQESLEEASGIKDFDAGRWGDVGKRFKMGYGKGGRVNYNPEDEIEDDLIDPDIMEEDFVEDPQEEFEIDDDMYNVDNLDIYPEDISPEDISSEDPSRYSDDEIIMDQLPSEEEEEIDVVDTEEEPEVVVDEPDEFSLKVGGEEEVQEPMHYEIDDDDRYDDIYMDGIEEGFTDFVKRGDAYHLFSGKGKNIHRYRDNMDYPQLMDLIEASKNMGLNVESIRNGQDIPLEEVKETDYVYAWEEGQSKEKWHFDHRKIYYGDDMKDLIEEINY
jgi:hypothetical protein